MYSLNNFIVNFKNVYKKIEQRVNTCIASYWTVSRGGGGGGGRPKADGTFLTISMIMV